MIWVKLIKKTIYYEGMPLRPLKVGKVSILISRNLIKKFKNKIELTKEHIKVLQEQVNNDKNSLNIELKLVILLKV